VGLLHGEAAYTDTTHANVGVDPPIQFTLNQDDREYEDGYTGRHEGNKYEQPFEQAVPPAAPAAAMGGGELGESLLKGTLVGRGLHWEHSPARA